MQRLLIIGCGMATARLLQSLVQGKHGFQIEVVGAEPSAAYNRVLLSALLAGDKTENDLILLDASWYARHNILLSVGESVVALDLQNKLATTDLDRTIAWDKVVFATGSRAYIPEFAGSRDANMLSFRDKHDLKMLQQAAQANSCAVVLGGGLLGLEAAYGLLSLGMKVTVVHRQTWLLNRQLDIEGAKLLQAQLEALGIEFRLGVQSAHWHDSSKQLELNDGSRLDCPVLVAAAGISPNSELASGAGIACDKGILVSQGMETSNENAYAIGECCQHGQQCYGLVAPVQEQADILARRLCGDSDAAYQYQECAVHLKVAGIAMVASGELNGKANENQIVRDPVEGSYRRLVIRNNRVCGFVLVGNKQHAAWYQHLLDTRTDINAIRPWLMFGEQHQAANAEFIPGVNYANQ